MMRFHRPAAAGWQNIAVRAGSGAGAARAGGIDAHEDRTLLIDPTPHLHVPASTPRIMWSVVLSLLPVVAFSVWVFGIGVLLVIAVACLGAIAVERAFGRRGTLGDGSAAITGLLLGLTLPPGFPLWMALLGGAFGIGFGKLIFGGLGQNVFNPALVGRAFLQAAFPIAITTYPAPGGSILSLRGDYFAWPLMRPGESDVVTAATPLGAYKFDDVIVDAGPLFFGNTGGSLGETSALLILLGGAWLAWQRFLNWRTPVAVLGTVAVLSALLHAIDAARFPGPAFMLFSGGLMLGAVYMATDMVTSPVTNMGRWIFGAGVGAIVVMIRMWGGLPEGVMYAILLMNALVPFINRVSQPRVFGTRPHAPGAS
jgi:Na+-translocating ferredoxin:NAD+ oxidoreductase subunit D